MFDYKKILSEVDFKGMNLEVEQSNKRVDIFGNKIGLLYLACRMIEFVEEECDNEHAEINFDIGIDLTDVSSALCIFINHNKEKNKPNDDDLG